MDQSLINSIVRKCTSCDSYGHESCTNKCAYYKYSKQIFDGVSDFTAELDMWVDCSIRDIQEIQLYDDTE